MTLSTEFDEMTQEERTFFSVVHPLDDGPEEKVDTEHLGPTGAQRAGSTMRAIAELRERALHPQTRVGADIVVTVDHTRHGLPGNAGQRGHIAHRGTACRSHASHGATAAV